MFVINPLLLLLASLIGVAHGYAEPGAYERVMFYYAYLADLQTNNGVPTTIGVDCARIKGTGKDTTTGKRRPCSLQQFLEFISADQTVRAPPFIYEGDVPPLGPTAEQILKHEPLTGKVNLQKVHIKCDSSDYSVLLSKVAKFFEYNSANPKVHEEVRKQALASMELVAELRDSASHQACAKACEKNGWTIKWTDERKVGDISVGKRINAIETVQDAANRGNGLGMQDLRTVVEATRDPSHRANVQVLKDGVTCMKKDQEPAVTRVIERTLKY